ncbi:MAG: family 20 glycosylhydrolase [Chloroflexi bacterium]|nr:family 20 glycosylhydrolase [Chloroflexota bacterium]
MLNLLPHPRKLTQHGGIFHVPSNGLLVLDIPTPAELLFTGKRLAQAFSEFVDVHLDISGSYPVPGLLRLSMNPGFKHAEGYRLTIEESGIYITGKDPAALFYGAATLIQLIQTHGRDLPLLTIEDYPDFPVRGVMLDISRDKVPTLETLLQLVDMLAGWKINQFQLYTEHTFAYHAHEVVWKNASPMTASDILLLDAYCRERFIELVPNQNSFGHMHRWLEHPEYKYLGETEEGTRMPWGELFEHPFSFSPAVPETLDFLEALYDELLPNFTSKLFNVGADETFDLGAGRTRALVEEKGKGRVYLDYLLELYQRVKSRGYTMQFWGDIINQYPDLVPLLPRDAIALEWGYEADHDFPGKTQLFAESGIAYYVCPGTSSWNTFAGRTDNAIENIRNAVENGLRNSAVGVLNTDWGDNGHWQPLPASYLGFAYGAGASWCYEQNRDMDVPAVLDTFAFRDTAGVMGKLAYDLGNAYQQPQVLLHNGSLLFWLYNHPIEKLLSEKQSTLDTGQTLHDTITYIDDTMASLDRAQIQHSDADLLKQEFRYAADLLKHGAKRGLLMLDNGGSNSDEMRTEFDRLKQAHRDVWLARNRPGGLEDSAARLVRARSKYLD